jgi:hypothetical protein
MTHRFERSHSLLAALLLALPIAVSAQAMSKPDHASAKTRISDTYKADKTACDAMSGNGKDVCVEQAKGKEKVAKAELEYAYTAKAADKNKVLVARAESTYAVAKERCDDQAGNAKDVCRSEAKAAETHALAEAKLGKEVTAAKQEAGAEMREADYKVAAEKCDAMAGDAKASCIAAAKLKFGQN